MPRSCVIQPPRCNFFFRLLKLRLTSAQFWHGPVGIGLIDFHDGVRSCGQDLNHAHDTHHVFCNTMTVKLCDRVAATVALAFLLIKGVTRPSIQMSIGRLHQYSHGSSTTSAGGHRVDSNELILGQIPFPHGVSVIVKKE